ncbi:MAG: hypothetical protein PWQ84_881 [Thermotogaceae bacterium]|nr:hypothetical protein [Thermotogaceae bacterium]
MNTNYQQILESLAVGDAMGMPTEFMTRQKIIKEFGFVDVLIDPEKSLIHSDLKYGQITDDTEQNLYLINVYCNEKKINVENTVQALIQWVEETDAEVKGYIGPSSLKALKKIQMGESPEEAGKGGTTCGAPMRVLAPVLVSHASQAIDLQDAIYHCTIPTHNTNLALEAAYCIGFAIDAALKRKTYEEIINAAFEGAKKGRERSKYDYVGASCWKKAEILLQEIRKTSDEATALDTIYYLNGTTLEANEIAAAVLGVFSIAKDDVWKAIKLGASVGGDTDTIAAISAVLASAYSNGHNIPPEILSVVLENNQLVLRQYADQLINMDKSK